MTKRPVEKRFKSCVTALILLVIVLGGILWGVWRLVDTHVSPTWARVWALVATALLPVVGLASFQLGQTESRGVMYGIDAGIERVTQAASRAIDLRATSARAMKQARQSGPSYTVELPQPQLEPSITVRPQIQSGEVVDL